MQWTPDRNAGFSTADPGKLFLPVVQSLVFNYNLVNVESQLAQSRSLLHWVRNVIHVRKAHPVFGLGTLEVAETDQESVLAFVRSYEGEGTQFGASAEDVLCVFSFAHNPSAVTVTAPHLAGRTLFDLFGGAQFPSFDDEGKVTITLVGDSGPANVITQKKIISLFETSKVRHLTAEDVYKLLLNEGLDIGLATVYRVLTQFEQAGILERSNFESGKAVYELNEGTHHDHLICTSCGKVEEFYDAEIERRQQMIAKDKGWILQDHAMSLYGLCGDCASRR
jgi:Fe2+ or Zn2+ uptake regulation protein